MVAQAITAASWLTSVARRELARFKEFMRWLRFGTSLDRRDHTSRSSRFTEINNVSAPDGHVLQPRHDFLEVTSYICHGLIDSPIDKWFSGEPPTALLPVPPTNEDNLEEIMRVAHGALSDPNEIKLNRVSLNDTGEHSIYLTGTQQRVRPYNLSKEGRNMHALLLGLADKCATLFKRAANGTARSVLLPAPPSTSTPAEKVNMIIHERTIVGAQQVEHAFFSMTVCHGSGNAKGVFTQFLAAYAPTDGRTSCTPTLCFESYSHCRMLTSH